MKKKGFTLAEVLIVIVVIGVVATLTVASLNKGDALKEKRKKILTQEFYTRFTALFMDYAFDNRNWISNGAEELAKYLSKNLNGEIVTCPNSLEVRHTHPAAQQFRRSADAYRAV